jgi:hypothetical protein
MLIRRNQEYNELGECKIESTLSSDIVKEIVIKFTVAQGLTNLQKKYYSARISQKVNNVIDFLINEQKD